MFKNTDSSFRPFLRSRFGRKFMGWQQGWRSQWRSPCRSGVWQVGVGSTAAPGSHNRPGAWPCLLQLAAQGPRSQPGTFVGKVNATQARKLAANELFAVIRQAV